jgi:uncharacterized protein (TIGR04255 family)
MADTTDIGPLPDYDNPPVVETVLGVQFDRLPGFKNAHLGAFWKTLDSNEWPAVIDVPPLPLQFERFTEAARWAKGLQLQLTQDPACRLQIKNKSGNRMIQVQNSRLHFNWLGESDAGYPRYEKVRDGFEWVLHQFIEFIGLESVGDFRPNQWEVTYVNHIPQGSVWNTFSDWKFFRLLGSVPTIENLVEAEGFTGEWHFRIPEERGRLHVEWEHRKKAAAEKLEQEFVRLMLTARGPVQENEDDVTTILDGLNLGRATVVRSFTNFMSDDANKHWGLKHASN